MYDQLILEPIPTNLPTSSNDLIFNEKLDLQIFCDTLLFKQVERMAKLTKLDVKFKNKFETLLKKVKTMISDLVLRNIFLAAKSIANDNPLNYHCRKGMFWMQSQNRKTTVKDFALVTNNRLPFKEVLYTFSRRRVYFNSELPILVTYRMWFCDKQYFFWACPKKYVSLTESGLYGKWMEYKNKIYGYLSFKKTRYRISVIFGLQ